MAYKKQSGFTLIELMIVVAIIGILASIALPSYQVYTTRAKVAEGLVLSDQLKLAITETFVAKGPVSMACADSASCQLLGTAPLDPLALASNANVQSVTSDATGVITIVYKLSITPSGSNSLLLTPVDLTGNVAVDLSAAAAGSTVRWSCKLNGNLPQRFRPTACRA